MRNRAAAWMLVAGVWMAMANVAAAADEDALPTTVLDTVVVSGKMPGPGLWKLSKGDHVMWLLGTIAPLPKRMDWDSSEVEAVIASSQQVLLPPTAEIDAGIGRFRALFLLPSLMKARNNPGKEKLQDRVPPELYARWLVQKKKYMGRDRGVEKRRPLVAAQELHSEAMDDLDLSIANVAARVASKTAERHDIPVTRPTLKIKLDDVKETIRDFSGTQLDDIDCLERTLHRLETEIETLKLRANAWAMGETEILQRLAYTDNYKTCAQAVFESQLAKKHGFDDMEGRIRAVWVEATEEALQKNSTTFALLPMPLIVREDGFVAPLLQRGYQLQGPAELAQEAARERDDEAVGDEANGDRAGDGGAVGDEANGDGAADDVPMPIKVGAH